MKHLTQFIAEKQNFLVNKKLKNKSYSSKTEILYTPKTKLELTEIIKKLINSGETNLNCIDVSKIENMNSLFIKYNDIDNIDISEWDVSNVVNMNMMFYKCKKFNCDLSNWDVSNVKTMNGMFDSCENFDCDLSKWDVSNAESMYEMFGNCKKFTGKGLENWDVSNVTNISYMFIGCEKLICDLSDWDISNVKDENMELTFYKCNSLKNKPSWYNSK